MLQAICMRLSMIVIRLHFISQQPTSAILSQTEIFKCDQRNDQQSFEFSCLFSYY